MKSPRSLTITAIIWDEDEVSKEFYDKVHELTSKEEVFAIATVVKTEGSTSGREGHKMIILQDGTILFGSVGGGCVESAAVSEALQAFREGEPRTIMLDMVEEEKGGVGMPCGGRLQLYVEPYLPKPTLLIIGSGPIAEPLAKLSKILGFRVVVVDFFARKEDFPTADEVISDDPDLARLKITPRTYVTVTTRHKYDEHALKSALSFNPAYVGLVASANRTEYIFKQITSEGFPEEKLRRVHAPAGLDIGANTPEEIALSILAEVVKARRAGTGKSLVEVKRGIQHSAAVVASEIPSPPETSGSRGRKPAVC